MNQQEQNARALVLFMLVAAASISTSCKSLDNPDPVPLTGSSSVVTVQPGSTVSTGAPTSPPPASAPVNGVSAPTILDPLPGTSTADTTPPLTVRNASASDGSALTYAFQVSSNNAFTQVAAEISGFPQGSAGASGTTTWEVTPALGSGRYFWRARATGAQGPGPFSPISDVFIGSSPSPSPSPPGPSGPSEIFDPLTNGSSVGQVTGGRFTGSGWQVTHRGNYIRYVVPTIQSGFVEWENRNLTRFNPQRDAFSLLGMWDPSRGAYRENPFRVHIRKLDTQGHNPPYVRMRFISNGDQHDVGSDFLDWNPSHTYRWRVEWGPGGGGNQARVLLDGRVIMRTSYGPNYSPRNHWIELGIEERAESIVGVIYRNVRIGRR